MSGGADDPADSPWRPVIAVGLLTFGAIVLGALIVPRVFNALVGAGRRWPALDGLREVEFDSLSSRTIMLLVVAGLWPAWRFGRMPAVRFGPMRLARGLALGVATMGALVLCGALFGAYRFEFDPDLKPPTEWAELVFGALLVGILEELLFRGIVFGTLRRALGFRSAAVLGSIFFAAVHFARPEPLVGTVHGHADAGLRLTEAMFYFGHESWHYVPYAFTLFIMGLLLCRVYERTGSLWWCVGLHAGWVFTMRLGGYLVEMREGGADWAVGLYGPSDVVAKSWAALVLITVFLAVWLLCERAGGKAGGHAG